MRELKVILFLSIIFLLFSNIYSQETTETTCQIIKKYSDGSVLVKIGDKEMLAITQDAERRMLKMKRDLLDAEREIYLKDSLMVNYDATVAQYEKTIANMKEYIVELEQMLKGYKELARDYKLMKEPWLNFSVGMGATSRDYKPALLMGLDFRRIIISGFIQERNSGLFLGTKFRLF